MEKIFHNPHSLFEQKVLSEVELHPLISFRVLRQEEERNEDRQRRMRSKLVFGT